MACVQGTVKQLPSKMVRFMTSSSHELYEVVQLEQC